ncbi:MAG: AAA family ATPase, partial [Bradyrhizobium sp.]|nr:AAA family ATPase [Bradyrhizobium sp.]
FASMCQWLYLRENEELRARASNKAAKAAELPDLHAVREVLKKSIAGVERVYFDGNPPRLMVDLGSQDGEHQVMELGQLSDGYRNLLALFLDFARRLVQANPTWPNPLEAPGILLIDEIELHLHPRWQQTVIPSLRSAFPNTQLIITTHSPAVLTTVRREHIHLLTSEHEFESLPDDVGTYGAENSRVLAEVFGTHARPPSVDTTQKLQRYLRLVEERKQDGDEARALRAELEDALGKSDPDLRRADLRVRQIEALGKR